MGIEFRIEKGTEEWAMFGELFKLYELARQYEFENTEWSEKFHNAVSEFKKKYKCVTIAKKFADAIELDNLEAYDKYKADRWLRGE